MSAAWVIVAFASALGIGVGGILAWILKGFRKGFAFIYAISAGIIMGLLFLEMIPESIELGGWTVLIIGTAMGILLFQSLHHLMDKVTIITNSPQKDIFIRSGLLLTLSIAIHNFPVGMSLGPTLGTEIGSLMLTTLVLHNIPEGIIIFTPLFLAGFGILTWLLLTTFIAVPIAAGALIGQLFNNGSTSLIAFYINLAITIIFMVAAREILGQAIKNSSTYYAISIAMLGFGLIYLYLNLLN